MAKIDLGALQNAISDYENRKLSQIIKDYGINEDQWLFIISENGMIIAKFQGYASFEQIEEYLYYIFFLSNKAIF